MKAETEKRSTDKSVEDINTATARLSELRQAMTMLVPLTEAERQERRLPNVGREKLRTLENRVAEARQRRELLPPAFDLRQLERDTAVAGALGACMQVIEDLRMAVRDTLLAVGN